jgi:hypothetical protein
MRIASNFDDRIKDLTTVEITTAAQRKQRRSFLDSPEVRSAEGAVAEPAVGMTIKQILENKKRRQSWNQAAEAEQQSRISKRIANYLRLARGEADISTAPALSQAERTQQAATATGAPEEVMTRAEAAFRRSRRRRASLCHCRQAPPRSSQTEAVDGPPHVGSRPEGP